MLDCFPPPRVTTMAGALKYHFGNRVRFEILNYSQNQQQRSHTASFRENSVSTHLCQLDMLHARDKSKRDEMLFRIPATRSVQSPVAEK